MGNNIQYGSLYFHTSTIYNWKTLIHQHNLYTIITNSLLYLHEKGCIRVYGFVIMPNHIHLIWQLIKNNGKERPVASFKKYTSHYFQAYLKKTDPQELDQYFVDWKTRRYNFWQPEPHWFLLLKEATTIQKLNYIHMNPLQENWNLVKDPVKYEFSSARFYETGVKNFNFLCDYRDFNDKAL